MPNIRQYVNQEPVFRADDRAQRATETLAYRQLRRAETDPAILHQATSQLQAGVSRLQQHMAVTEISQGATAAIGLQNDLTKQWNGIASSTDPNLIGQAAKKFNEEVVNPALEKFGDGFSTDQGKLWATEHANSLRQHFFEKTAADSSTAAGDALLQNLDALKNHATDLVQNDPSSMNAALGLVDTSTEALIKNSPDLPAGAASKIRTTMVARMKREIVTAAAAGIAMKNPEAAREFLAGNPAVEDHMDADQIRTMERFANTVATHQKEQAKADATAQKQANKKAFDGAINQIELSTIQPDGSVKLPKDYYSNLLKAGSMPGASPTLVRAMANAGRTMARDENKAITDPATYHSFMDRLSGTGQALEASDIYQARSAGQLSDQDMKFFLSRAAGKGDPVKAAAEKRFNAMVNSFSSAFAPTIMTLHGFTKDPAGAQRLYNYRIQAQKFFDDAYARGDWEATLDPSSPRYLGKLAPEFMRSTKGTPVFQGVPVGAVQGNFRFTGGNPAHRQNWTRIGKLPGEAAPAAPPAPGIPELRQ